MALSIEELEKLRAELKNKAERHAIGDVFDEMRKYSFFEGYKPFETNFVANHFPQGFHIYCQQLVTFVSSCINNEANRVKREREDIEKQAKPKREQEEVEKQTKLKRGQEEAEKQVKPKRGQEEAENQKSTIKIRKDKKPEKEYDYIIPTKQNKKNNQENNDFFLLSYKNYLLSFFGKSNRTYMLVFILSSAFFIIVPSEPRFPIILLFLKFLCFILACISYFGYFFKIVKYRQKYDVTNYIVGWVLFGLIVLTFVIYGSYIMYINGFVH